MTKKKKQKELFLETTVIPEVGKEFRATAIKLYASKPARRKNTQLIINPTVVNYCGRQVYYIEDISGEMFIVLSTRRNTFNGYEGYLCRLTRGEIEPGKYFQAYSILMYNKKLWTTPMNIKLDECQETFRGSNVFYGRGIARFRGGNHVFTGFIYAP